MGITATQSYSLVIRDVFYDAVSADPFFADYACRKTRALRVQPDLLPYLGVYIIDEIMLPDGDANTGMIRFSHTLRVGFSVFIANNDDAAAELQLDAAFWRIMGRLWPDPKIMSMLVTASPDNTLIEGIARGVRRHEFGAGMLTNETPLAELQYDVSVLYRTGWAPPVIDDLKTIDVITGIKPGDTQTEMDQRQQIHVRYQFDQLRKAIKEQQP
jgi:hypothetical protein